MEYRVLPRSGEKISVLGMGSAVIGALPKEKIIAAVRRAVAEGINFFDMAGGHASIFEAYGKALRGIRERVYLQIHFGADYTSGEYGWTTSLDEIRRSVNWQLEKLGTDYIDFGYIHCIDEDSDLEAYRQNGVIDYILELKKKGIVRHIGLSSHTPSVTNKILNLGIVDVLMFSINPLYDYGEGDYAIGTSDERYALYRRCESEGIGIVVMKPFCAGRLLDSEKSPLGKALTKAQCIQYALDKPGVVCTVPGYGSEEELAEVITEYLNSTEEERDYSQVSSLVPDASRGKCVYCKHCHPCPVGIDIALVNKYYDLAKLGDKLAREHYLTLSKRASDCIRCGHCNSRCPFRVEQSARMEEIAEYFGE